MSHDTYNSAATAATSAPAMAPRLRVAEPSAPLVPLPVCCAPDAELVPDVPAEPDLVAVPVPLAADEELGGATAVILVTLDQAAAALVDASPWV